MAHADATLETCLDHARVLIRLAKPPGDGSVYRAGHRVFTLSSTQDESVYSSTEKWVDCAEKSLEKLERTLRRPPYVAIQAWIGERTGAIQSKIHQRTALYFDALLLGIVGNRTPRHLELQVRPPFTS